MKPPVEPDDRTGAPPVTLGQFCILMAWVALAVVCWFYGHAGMRASLIDQAAEQVSHP